GLATATHKSEGRSNARHDDDDDDEDCVVMPSQATSSLLRIRKHDDDEHRCRVATTTPPVITAPALSGVAASVGTSTATVAFTTDVPAVGTLFYGTQNPFSFIKALGNPSELTSHAFSLAGLAANTTYFYVVLASNAIGTAVSNILTFTTSALADVTPPVVSNIAATSTATGSATLSWTTNELSTSKVFFGTTTPLNLLATTTPFVANSSLTTSHSITVPGLATTTTYHFVVSSSDAAGNTATSSDIQFLIP
ncbi:MAG: fibronectin type III domain-containing protein, partial [Candidatus Paceibacterota bacterium]